MQRCRPLPFCTWRPPILLVSDRKTYRYEFASVCVVSLLTGALALGLAAPARAHLPEFFGRYYVLEGAAPPARATCTGDRELLREDVARRSLDLAAVEAGAGAYNVTVADQRGELGKLYSQLCNHPAALREYRRAVHLLRISDGLLTPAQIPYLRAEADAYRAIGDFKSAQKTWRYIFRIHEMGRGALDDAALRDCLEYFAFARAVMLDPRSPSEKRLFVEAYNDSRAMLEAQRESKTLPFAGLSEVALSHLANLYLMMGVDLSADVGMDSGDAFVSALRRMQEVGYAHGVKLLEWLRDEAQQQDPTAVAGYTLRLGNWHMWNSRARTACELYAEAWLLAGEGAGLRERLAMPSELPEDPFLWAPLLASDVPVKARLSGAFSVSARGDVSRVNVEGLEEADKGQAGRIARWLRDSHARPAVVDGACAAGAVSGRRYRVVR